MTAPVFTMACQAYDRMQPLRDGTVRLGGAQLNFLDLPVEETFFRMLKFGEFDIAELSLSSYTLTLSQGAPFVASGLQTALALLLVMPFAVLGLDPVLTLFAWFSGVAVLGLVVLYFLTSISVVVFFRRTRLDTRPWQTLIAPVLAAALIAALAVLVLTNFTLLIGGSAATAVPLVLSVPLVLLVGVALESSRRHPAAKRPARGRHRISRPHRRPAGDSTAGWRRPDPSASSRCRGCCRAG